LHHRCIGLRLHTAVLSRFSTRCCIYTHVLYTTPVCAFFCGLGSRCARTARHRLVRCRFAPFCCTPTVLVCTHHHALLLHTPHTPVRFATYTPSLFTPATQLAFCACHLHRTARLDTPFVAHISYGSTPLSLHLPRFAHLHAVVVVAPHVCGCVLYTYV